VTRVANKNRQVVLGKPDGRITPRAGLHLVAKLDQLLGITDTIDAGGPSFKQRKRGLMLGGVMVSLAETMLAGPSGAAIRAQSPFGRVAEPEEIAAAVVWLASPAAEWASGAVIDLNGASYLR